MGTVLVANRLLAVKEEEEGRQNILKTYFYSRGGGGGVVAIFMFMFIFVFTRYFYPKGNRFPMLDFIRKNVPPREHSWYIRFSGIYQMFLPEVAAVKGRVRCLAL